MTNSGTLARTDAQLDKFAQDLSTYQKRKRSHPREDFLFASLGGLAMGGLGGFVVGAVPGLPAAVVGGLVTGTAGFVAGGALGGTLGVVGGGVFAACRVHCHAPDEVSLSKHVFSHFRVVPMRHQSRRITRKLVKHEVLYARDGRRVVSLDDKRIDAALDEVRVFSHPLSSKQRLQVKNILHTQVDNTEAADSPVWATVTGHAP